MMSEIVNSEIVRSVKEPGTRKQEPGDSRTKPVGQGKSKKEKVIAKVS